MSAPAAPTDWDPALYARFGDLRLRPALDLLAALPPLPEGGTAVDLGCGAGAAAPALHARISGRALTGIDSSGAMLARAEATGLYAALHATDIAAWAAAPNPAAPALVFSNAALQWLPDHARLIPRLARVLAPGGVLAVQMPRQTEAPSHRLLRQTARALFPDRFDSARTAPWVDAPVAYARMLAPEGTARVWETEYLQPLPPVAAGHPVRHFTWSTAARPILARLDLAETERFRAAYDAALAEAYPLEPDGACLFAFRRLFFTLQRSA